MFHLNTFITMKVFKWNIQKYILARAGIYFTQPIKNIYGNNPLFWWFFLTEIEFYKSYKISQRKCTKEKYSNSFRY